MSITKIESNHFKTLSIISAIAVLYLHSYVNNDNNFGLSNFLQGLINNLARFAVPFFFITSGYFFFLPKDNDPLLFGKIIKRFRTLLIPYLLWCILFIAFIYLASFIKGDEYHQLSRLKEGDLIDFIKFVFLTPAAFHLWFIRDLILLSLLSPCIKFVVVHIPYVFLFLIFILGSMFYYNNELWALYTFSIGAIYGRTEKPLFFNISNKISIIALIIALIVIVFYSIVGYSIEYSHIKYLVITLFVIGVWHCTKSINTKDSNKLLKLANYSFMIYCAHMPLLVVVKDILSKGMDISRWGPLVVTIITPVITILIVIPFLKLLKSYFPHIYGILSGGR